MKMRTGLLSIATLGTLVACSSSNGTKGTASSTQGSGTLSQNAVFLNAQSASDVDVEPAFLAFPASTHSDQLERAVGDIIVGDKGGPSTKNPWGFLRKVTAAPVLDGETITIATTAATLNEAVSPGDVPEHAPGAAAHGDGPRHGGRAPHPRAQRRGNLGRHHDSAPRLLGHQAPERRQQRDPALR